MRDNADPNRHWIENLRYSIDVFDDGGNLVEVLGRVADLAVAHAALWAAVANIPTSGSASASAPA